MWKHLHSKRSIHRASSIDLGVYLKGKNHLLVHLRRFGGSVSKAATKAKARYRNQVEIVGRLSKAPEEKTLPSGDLVVELRIIVERDDREGVDTLDVATWRSQLRRRALTLKPEDWVRVKGVIRRRFWRSGAALASRWQVEARELERV